jgi:hypothetical protein
VELVELELAVVLKEELEGDAKTDSKGNGQLKNSLTSNKTSQCIDPPTPHTYR